jgi:signal peptidase I
LKKIKKTDKAKAMSDTAPVVEETKKTSAKEEWSDMAKTAIIAVIIALIIRTFIFEPFNIPSSSMRPTLLVGDYLFVSKYEYGYSRHSFPFGVGGFEGRIMSKMPERGDVIVFKLPSNTSVDYIKRVVALPGDTVQVIGGRLYLNDERVEREVVGLKDYVGDRGGNVKVQHYIETLPGGVMHDIYEVGDSERLDNTEKYRVPEGHVFAMGDNRDNSMDSRVLDHVGYIPVENIVGRAERLFFSTNGKARIYEIWKWPFSIRYNRIFNAVGPVKPAADKKGA